MNSTERHTTAYAVYTGSRFYCYVRATSKAAAFDAMRDSVEALNVEELNNRNRSGTDQFGRTYFDAPVVG